MMESSTTLSLYTQLDKITHGLRSLLNSHCEEEFIRYISNHEKFRLQWLARENECGRLQDLLSSAVKDISVLENQLQLAKKLVDEETTKRKKIALERNTLAQQLNAVRRVLLKDHYAELPASAKEELMFLEMSSSEYVDAESGDHREFSNLTNGTSSANVKAAAETLSSHSENDLNDIFVLPTKGTPAKCSSFVKDLKEQMNTKIRDTPNVSENQGSDPKIFLAISTPNRLNIDRHEDFLMETEMSPIGKGSSRVSTPKSHNFVSRTFMMPESCTRCYRKIAFGRTVFKCMDCAIVVHPECRGEIPHSCKSFLVSMRIHHQMGLLSDYVSQSLPPFIPSVVVTCIKEIERRGLQESRLYGMLGSSSLVNHLLEDIRCNKEIRINLINYDTHSICRALMNFFENLKEPLIPRTSWKTFADAVIHDDRGDCDLVQAISTLPRVNRDTLAFIMLHLHNVIFVSSQSIEDVVVIFSTVIFGHGGRNLYNASSVTRELISLPYTYWSRFVTTSSLLRTPIGSPSKIDYVETLLSPFPMRKRRFFDRES